MGNNGQELASDISRALRLQQTGLEEAKGKETELMQKVASLEGEMGIYKEILNLVADGKIEPSLAPQKVAELLEDPSQLEVLKEALALGFQWTPSIGQLGEEDTSQTVEGDEDPLSSHLKDVAPQLRRL